MIDAIVHRLDFITSTAKYRNTQYNKQSWPIVQSPRERRSPKERGLSLDMARRHPIPSKQIRVKVCLSLGTLNHGIVVAAACFIRFAVQSMIRYRQFLYTRRIHKQARRRCKCCSSTVARAQISTCNFQHQCRWVSSPAPSQTDDTVLVLSAFPTSYEERRNKQIVGSSS